jgi:nucleoside-diphosphate-sugar epimerase
MGPHVAQQLTERGHKVTLFHRNVTTADLPGNTEHIYGDRNRLEDFKAEFKKIKPDIVIDMMLLNESQAKTLVEVFTGLAGCLIVAGSCDVYLQYDLLRGEEVGKVLNDRLTEEAPLRKKLYPYRAMVPDKNHQLYDYDKILVERAVMSHPELPATVLRLPMVYGPNDYQHRFWSYIKRMLDHRSAIILDKKQANWQITRGFAENCAGAIVAAALKEKARNRIYNVGEPEVRSEKEWVRKLAGIIGWNGNIVILDKENLPEHLQSDLYFEHHLNIDTGRIRKELGYVESVDIDEALARTIGWEKENPPQAFEDSFDYTSEDEILKSI